MATITGVETPIKEFGEECKIVTWSLLTTTNNYGSAVRLPGWADRSVQLTGTLSAAGAVTMYGSNVFSPNAANDDDWAILNDAQGDPIVLNSLRIEAIIEVPLWVRPKITAGDGSTSLTVRMLLRKPNW